jgi:hypothetical protein
VIRETRAQIQKVLDDKSVNEPLNQKSLELNSNLKQILGYKRKYTTHYFKPGDCYDVENDSIISFIIPSNILKAIGFKSNPSNIVSEPIRVKMLH